MKRIEILRNEDTSCDRFAFYDPSYAYGNRMLKYKANGICCTVDIVAAYENKALLGKYPCYIQEQIQRIYKKQRIDNLAKSIITIQSFLPQIEIEWKNVEVLENDEGAFELYKNSDEKYAFCQLQGFHCMVIPLQSTLGNTFSSVVRMALNDRVQRANSESINLPHSLQWLYLNGQAPGWKNSYNPASQHQSCTIVKKNSSCKYDAALCNGIPPERVFQYEDKGTLVCADIVHLYQKHHLLDSWLQSEVKKRYISIHKSYVDEFIKQYNANNTDAKMIKGDIHMISVDNRQSDPAIDEFGVSDVFTTLEKRRYLKTNKVYPFQLYGLYAKPVSPVNIEYIWNQINHDVYYAKGMSFRELHQVFQFKNNEKSSELNDDDGIVAKDTVLVFLSSETGIRVRWYTDKKQDEANHQQGIGKNSRPVELKYYGLDADGRVVVQRNKGFEILNLSVKCEGRVQYKVLEIPAYPYSFKPVNPTQYVYPTDKDIRQFLNAFECKKDKQKKE